jgi:hypothetical protein
MVKLSPLAVKLPVIVKSPDGTPGLIGTAKKLKVAVSFPSAFALMVSRRPVSPCSQRYAPFQVPVSVLASDGPEQAVRAGQHGPHS